MQARRRLRQLHKCTNCEEPRLLPQSSVRTHLAFSFIAALHTFPTTNGDEKSKRKRSKQNKRLGSQCKPFRDRLRRNNTCGRSLFAIHLLNDLLSNRYHQRSHRNLPRGRSSNEKGTHRDSITFVIEVISPKTLILFNLRALYIVAVLCLRCDITR